MLWWSVEGGEETRSRAVKRKINAHIADLQRGRGLEVLLPRPECALAAEDLGHLGAGGHVRVELLEAGRGVEHVLLHQHHLVQHREEVSESVRPSQTRDANEVI